mmetsp:Transcript_49849/g.132444  ORF Transcript_49849/g.132444 Transcript_49849/m.132444 type:complete len:271 (+) Transcript_49849:216-1028(+)
MQPGGKSCPQRRGLGHLRPEHRGSHDVGLDLHHQIALGEAAVGLHGLDGVADVLLHCSHHVDGLESHALQHGPRDVPPARLQGHPDQRAAGVGAPPRREEAREARHEGDAARVRHGRRQVADLWRSVDDLQLVPQPLHAPAGDRHRPLQGVDGGRVRPQLPAHRRQEPVRRRHGLRASVDHHEAAGPVGVFHLAHLRAPLAQQGRVLVADGGRDRHARQGPALDPAQLLRVGPDLREAVHGNAQLLADALVPIERLEVHQHGARGIRDVG